MPKSTTTANNALDAFLRAVDPAWRSGATRFIALHTASPGAAGNQTTNEASYTGYARVAVTASTGFTAASSGESENTALIQFPECTGSRDTVTFVSIGTASSGTGQVIYFGALAASRSISAGIQPQFSAGSLVATES